MGVVVLVAGEDKGLPREWIGVFVTLAGTIVGIVGAAQAWTIERDSLLSALGSALYVSPRAGRLSGFQVKIGFLSAGWLLVMACGLCGLLLLAAPKVEDRPPFFRMQATLGAFILFLGVAYIRPQLGPVMAMISGTLLIAGAFLRYR